MTHRTKPNQLQPRLGSFGGAPQTTRICLHSFPARQHIVSSGRGCNYTICGDASLRPASEVVSLHSTLRIFALCALMFVAQYLETSIHTSIPTLPRADRTLGYAIVPSSHHQPLFDEVIRSFGRQLRSKYLCFLLKSRLPSQVMFAI
jgi:hypothetical protein